MSSLFPAIIAVVHKLVRRIFVCTANLQWFVPKEEQSTMNSTLRADLHFFRDLVSLEKYSRKRTLKTDVLSVTDSECLQVPVPIENSAKGTAGRKVEARLQDTKKW